MKIAICYSGDIRTYKYCSENHFNVFKNADLYFSTWTTFNNTKQINDPWHILMPEETDVVVTEDYIKKHTNKNFNIIKIELENKENFRKSIIDNDPFFNLKCQYYKIKKCFDLLEDKYDFIVRMRPDIQIQKIKYEDTKIIHNNCIWFNHCNQNNYQINEMIWVCNYSLMSKAVKIYENFEKIKNNLSEVYGERICYKNLEMENLIENLQFLDFDYRVLRS